MKHRTTLSTIRTMTEESYLHRTHTRYLVPLVLQNSSVHTGSTVKQQQQQNPTSHQNTENIEDAYNNHNYVSYKLLVTILHTEQQ